MIHYGQIIEETCALFNEHHDIIKSTPLTFSRRLSEKYNCNVWLKREDLQEVRSFKIRGAFNNIMKNLNKIKESGMMIVCASAGNHAQGVAYICNRLEINSVIFVPTVTPKQKIEKMRYYGGSYTEIKIIGRTFDECLAHSLQYCELNNGLFIHPYNDIDTITGQGTIMKEIYNDTENVQPDIVIAGIGGGGLMSGIQIYKDCLDYTCKIIGAEPETCASMKQALVQNKPITLETDDMFVDGATVKKVGDICFNICKNYMKPNDIKLIPIENLCEDIMNLHQYDGIVVEPAGALSISCLNFLPEHDIKDKNIVCIISGGNNDALRYGEIMERSLSYKKSIHYYVLSFVQKPGELKDYLNKIMGDNIDIVKFKYSKSNNDTFDDVLIGIQVSSIGGLNNIEELEEKMKRYDIKYHKIKPDNILLKFI